MTTKTKSELHRAVERFRSKRVLVIGDLMLDLYVEGPPRFVSQEAPVVVIAVDRKYFKLGGAANSAENVQALGGTVFLAGIVGNHVRHDDSGRSFFETVRRSKLPTAGLIRDASRPTTIKTRILSQGQQIVRVDEEYTRPLQKNIESKLIAYVNRTIPKVHSILVSDYNKGVVTRRVMDAIRKGARRYQKRVIVDPRPQHRDLYHDVFCITPNDVELSRMFGSYEAVDEKALLPMARKLQKEFNIACVALTRGSRGMDIVQERGTTHIPALSKKAVDVSGAGDTVAAVFALGSDELAMPALGLVASCAAKVSIEKHGTATVSTKELLTVLRDL